MMPPPFRSLFYFNKDKTIFAKKNSGIEYDNMISTDVNNLKENGKEGAVA